MDLSVERVGNASLINVSGELDADTGYPLFLAAAKEAENGSPEIVFDLSGVTFIDSVGLGMLIRSRDELADQHGAAVILRNPSAWVSRLLEMTALTAHFRIETESSQGVNRT